MSGHKHNVVDKKPSTCIKILFPFMVLPHVIKKSLDQIPTYPHPISRLSALQTKMYLLLTTVATEPKRTPDVRRYPTDI